MFFILPLISSLTKKISLAVRQTLISNSRGSTSFSAAVRNWISFEAAESESAEKNLEEETNGEQRCLGVF